MKVVMVLIMLVYASVLVVVTLLKVTLTHLRKQFIEKSTSG